MRTAVPDRTAAASTTAPQLLRAARVRRLHGVHGEVRAEALGGDASRFAAGMRLRVEDGEWLTVERTRPGVEGEVLLTFAEISTREAAAMLTGKYLCVSQDEARPLPEGEWFVWQLVGLRALDETGAEVGTVTDVEEAVASDVLVLRTARGERRLPMVREFIKSVDVEAGTMVVHVWDEEDA